MLQVIILQIRTYCSTLHSRCAHWTNCSGKFSRPFLKPLPSGLPCKLWEHRFSVPGLVAFPPWSWAFERQLCQNITEIIGEWWRCVFFVQWIEIYALSLLLLAKSLQLILKIRAHMHCMLNLKWSFTDSLTWSLNNPLVQCIKYSCQVQCAVQDFKEFC